MATMWPQRPDTFYVNRLQAGTAADLRHSGRELGAFPQLPRRMVAIPGYKSPDPLLDRGARPKADLALQVGHVGAGLRDVAWLHREKLARGGSAGRLLDEAQDLLDLDRPAAADVVDVVEPPGRATAGRRRMLPRPLRVALRRAIEEPHHGFRRIVDVGEISPHLSLIEQRDRPAFEHGGGEAPDRHVRSAPRAIDGEEPQAGRR